MKIGIRELKARAPQVVREVRETGVAVDITFRGEVVARLSPAEQVEPADFATAWHEFQAVVRAIGTRAAKGTSKARKAPDTTFGWRRTL